MSDSIQSTRRVFDFPATEDTPAYRVTFTADTTIHRFSDDDPNATTDGFFRGRKLDPAYMLDSMFYALVESTDPDGTEWQEDMAIYGLGDFYREITMNRLQKYIIERLTTVDDDEAARIAGRAFKRRDRDRRTAERAAKRAAKKKMEG